MYAFTQGSIALRFFPDESDISPEKDLALHIVFAPAVTAYVLFLAPCKLFSMYAKAISGK